MIEPSGQLPRIALETLLRALPAGKLELAFSKLFGDAWQIVDCQGKLLMGSVANKTLTAIAIPLHVNFDAIGALEVSDTPRQLIETAAAWLELLLAGAFNYRLATDLYPALVNAQHDIFNNISNARNRQKPGNCKVDGENATHAGEDIETMRLEQYQRYQIEKMQAVGSLAAGMAHEINNPAGFVKSNLSTATQYVKQISKVLNAFHSGDINAAQAAWKREDIDGILEEFPDLLSESVVGVSRIANVASSLDSYARIKYNAIEAIDVNRSVRTMASIISDKTNNTVSLKLNLTELPMLMADESRINQMLLLILMNGVAAINKEGEIELTTTADNDQIRIAIRDNGCGITAENLTRIFDPFFTTQDVGKGMGLGLTISRDIAAAHGGHIEVDSTPQKGSIFTVCLPVVNGLTPSPGMGQIPFSQ